MTKVITRYFDDLARARAVRYELLYRRRFPQKILSLFESSEGLADALEAEGVAAETGAEYAARMDKGGAVLLVRAGYKPLGVAQITRDVTAAMGAVDIGDLPEETEVADPPAPALSVLQDHPLFMTRMRDPESRTFHMADWPIPLISRRKPYTGSLFARHARMADFPIPLISKRKPYTGSVIPRHGHMADFPIPLISKRKPYTGSLIPRHARMANWPFPHLINGKTGTNALIPGGPRMADFPIPLISKRKPYTGSVIPRHGRMANFPIPLTNRRKPYTGSVIPRHARMGSFPIPLLARDVEGLGRSFTVSGMFGIPTILRRQTQR